MHLRDWIIQSLGAWSKNYSISSSSSLIHFRVLPLKIKLIENDIKLGNLCTYHLHARLVAVDSCMSHWILPQPCRHWPAASIARVSCSSLFSPSDVLPFCVRNWGTTIWFWGGGGGWHFVEINILTLIMLKIKNLSSSVKKTNNLTLTFLQFFFGGGGLPIFPIYFC